MTLTRYGIAYRIAQDLPDGSYVNLGVGIPSLAMYFIPEEKEVLLHSENGILGFGPVEEEHINPYINNANASSVSLVSGASLFDHSLSFAMIRGGHLTHTVMGAIQVSANGDLANWHFPGSNKVPSVGGAMDLAANVANVYIAMTHVTSKGEPKIVNKCQYPLTAANSVKRIYTDLAVIDVTSNGLELKEVAPGAEVSEVIAKTEAPLRLSPGMKEMDIPEKFGDKQLIAL